MEDADILTKKRDNSHGCSSYLLSSESLGDHQFGLSTPNFGEALTSSYFNSPSSSEKVVHPGTRLDSLQDLTELTLDLDDSDRESSKQKCSQRSPFHPEDRIAGLRCGKQHLDILSDLLALGCTSICEKICSYMKAQDLYRFVQIIRFHCCPLQFTGMDMLQISCRVLNLVSSHDISDKKKKKEKSS